MDADSVMHELEMYKREVGLELATLKAEVRLLRERVEGLERN